MDEWWSSEYKYQTYQTLTDGNRGDKFRIMHPERSCDIANEICWYNDEKRPNENKWEAIFLEPLFVLSDFIFVLFHENFLESHFAREKVYHRRWKEYTDNGDKKYKNKILWKEECAYENKGRTWYQSESTKCWYDEIDNQEKSSKLFKETLESFWGKKFGMEEVVGKSRDEEEYPHDEKEFLNSSRELMNHEYFSKSK